MGYFRMASHRGTTNARWGENTVESFTRAIQQGADWMETDMVINRSGDFVIMHDLTVDRTTRSSGYIHQMSNRQINLLRTNQGNEIPWLSDLLKLGKKTGTGVIPELKGDLLGRYDDPDTWLHLKQVIQSYGMMSKTMITSHLISEVAKVKSHEPTIKCGVIWANDSRAPTPADVGDFEYCTLEAHLVTRKVVETLNEAGVQVIGRLRGGDDPDGWRKHYDCGSWGYITDRAGDFADWRRSVTRRR
jgi:glycerophosphoryl diester phosphodiesterase